MRLAAQAKGGYYPTPDRVVDMIAGLIDTPYGYHHYNRETLRILDPCCGGGDAVAQLAEELRHRGDLPVETFGVELHRDRAQQAEEAAGPRPRRRPVRHLHRKRGLRPRLPQPAIRLGPGGQARRARLPHPLHQVSGRGRAAGLHRAPAKAGGVGPLPVHPLPEPALLGLPGPGAGGVRPGCAPRLPQGRPHPRRLRRGDRSTGGRRET